MRRAILTAMGILMAVGAGAGETTWRIAGPAGTLCKKGERYEAIRVEKNWRALCYAGDLDEARAQAGADHRAVSSRFRAEGCRTCSLSDAANAAIIVHFRGTHEAHHGEH